MLLANLARFASPAYMAWTVSGDLIIMMSRAQKRTETKPEIICFDVQKQRNGPTGPTYMESFMEYIQFRDTDYEPQSRQRSTSAGFDDVGKPDGLALKPRTRSGGGYNGHRADIDD